MPTCHILQTTNSPLTYPVNMLLKRVFRDRLVAEDNLYILSSRSYNLPCTSRTSTCVASVWMCKHCAKAPARYCLLRYMRWYHKSPTVPLFNYKQRRRSGRLEGWAILMKMGHVIKVDLTRFICSSGSRTVNMEIKWTVPLTTANTQDKIWLLRNCFYPTNGKWGRD